MDSTTYKFPEEEVFDLLDGIDWTFTANFQKSIPLNPPPTGFITVRGSNSINHADMPNAIRVYPIQIAAYAPYERQAKLWLQEIAEYFDVMKSQTFDNSALQLPSYSVGMLQNSMPQYTGDSIPCNGAKFGVLYKYVLQLSLEMLRKK